MSENKTNKVPEEGAVSGGKTVRISLSLYEELAKEQEAVRLKTQSRPPLGFLLENRLKSKDLPDNQRDIAREVSEKYDISHVAKAAEKLSEASAAIQIAQRELEIAAQGATKIDEPTVRTADAEFSDAAGSFSGHEEGFQANPESDGEGKQRGHRKTSGGRT